MLIEGGENVTEIVRFHDYRLNEVEAATFGMTKDLDGCVRSYHGTEVNSVRGGASGVWVQDWLSLSHHTAFQKSDIYPSFTASVSDFADAERIEILHVQLRPFPAQRAFSAPITEMTIATLRTNVGGQEFGDVMKDASKGLDALSYGPVMENSMQYFIVNGWESVEEYLEAQSNAQIFRTIGSFAGLDTRLYKLST